MASAGVSSDNHKPIPYPDVIQTLGVDLHSIKPKGRLTIPEPRDSMSNRRKAFYEVAKNESLKMQKKLEFKRQVLFNTANRNPRVYKVTEVDKATSQSPYGSSSGITKYLRYFTVRNRADGTQFSEEREIHLARSLVNPVDKIDLAKEEDRARSFEGWRFEANIKGNELATRGFYHLGDADRVQCVFCKGILRDWSKGDDALREHHRHFPTCPFILKLDVGNVPIDHTPYNIPYPSGVCSQHSPTEHKPSLPSSDSSISLFAHETRTLVNKIEHPQFKDPEQRFNSFMEDGLLPKWAVVSAVTAGFFKNTSPDPSDDPTEISCRCFACDLVLQRPRDHSRPNVWWDEHMSRRPSCPYILLYRRDEVHERAPGQNLSAQKTIDLYPTMSTLQHRVEMREIRSRVDLPLYYELQKMGYSRDLLIYVVQRRLESTGVDFDSIVDVYEHLNIYQREYEARKKMKPELTVSDYVQERKDEVERRREELKSKMLKNSLSTGSSGPEDSSGGNSNLLENYDDNQLAEMNRQLKDDRTCKICMDHMVNTVFLPCGHLVTCHECAPRVKICPVCRLAITSTVLTSM